MITKKTKKVNKNKINKAKLWAAFDDENKVDKKADLILIYKNQENKQTLDPHKILKILVNILYT